MRFALAALVVAALFGVAHADGAIVVLVDRAMSSDKIATVTHALTENLDAFDSADDIAIISYAKTAHVDLPLQSVSHRERVSAAVANVRTAKESSLVAGLRTAGDVLSRTKRLRKYVLVITETDTITGMESAVDKLRKQGVQVSAVGYQATNRLALKALVANGGEVHSIDHASDLSRAFKASAMLPPPDDVAVVVLIDRNGTMRGGKNLAIAKSIAHKILDTLTPSDTFALVGFDSDPYVYIQSQPASSKSTFSTGIGRVDAGIGTNYYAGLKAAYEILQSERASQKHVILIGDGEAPSDGIAELLGDMRASQIMVSTVGVAGADRNLLSVIADAGDGRLYTAEEIGAMSNFFVRQTSP